MTETVYEDVFRLDIAMNNIPLTADFKSGADIATKLNNLSLIQALIAKEGVKGSQQFHTDINIPAYLILLFDYLIIFNADDILNSLKRFHKLNLTHKIINDSLKECFCSRIIKTL